MKFDMKILLEVGKAIAECFILLCVVLVTVKGRLPFRKKEESDIMKNMKSVKSFLDDEIKKLGEVLQCDRAYLIVLHPNSDNFTGEFKDLFTSLISEHCKDGVSKEINNFQRIPVSMFNGYPKPSAFEYFQNNDFGVFYFDESKYDKMPYKVNINKVWHCLMEKQQNRCVLFCMIRQCGRPVGILGVDYIRDISEDQIEKIKDKMEYTATFIKIKRPF